MQIVIVLVHCFFAFNVALTNVVQYITIYRIVAPYCDTYCIVINNWMLWYKESEKDLAYLNMTHLVWQIRTWQSQTLAVFEPARFYLVDNTLVILNLAELTCIISNLADLDQADLDLAYVNLAGANLKGLEGLNDKHVGLGRIGRGEGRRHRRLGCRLGRIERL